MASPRRPRRAGPRRPRRGRAGQGQGHGGGALRHLRANRRLPGAQRPRLVPTQERGDAWRRAWRKRFRHRPGRRGQDPQHRRDRRDPPLHLRPGRRRRARPLRGLQVPGGRRAGGRRQACRPGAAARKERTRRPQLRHPRQYLQGHRRRAEAQPRRRPPPPAPPKPGAGPPRLAPPPSGAPSADVRRRSAYRPAAGFGRAMSAESAW